MVNYVKKHLPAIIGLVLVVVDALAQAGVINPNNKEAALINGVLSAMGLGVLHFRVLNAGKPSAPVAMTGVAVANVPVQSESPTSPAV